MKRLQLFVLIIFFCGAAVCGQFPPRDLNPHRRIAVITTQVEPIYRKPTKKELKAVEPRRELFARYSGFLRQPNTGLTKLIDDKGCAENTKVLVATEDCLRYTMPGAGSSFSFRTESYRIPRLSDITFTSNSFQAAGVRLHGIFVNLGKVELDKVTRDTKGLKFLNEFQPETDFEKAKELDQKLSEGIVNDGFLYRRGLFIVDDATFALRSVAYSGKYWRAVSDLAYNEFDFDKRKDVLVVFRIVEKDASGNVTILWKRLWEKESPEMIREAPPLRDPA